MISIILPVYNAERFIEESIQSILNQTYDNFELIICNDASTDKSHSIIEAIKDERIIYVQNKSNIGYLKTINRLFALSKAELIAFQDADDISHKLRLAKQVDYLNKNDLISIVGTNFNLINLKGDIIRSRNMIDDPDRLSEEILIRNPFQKPSILFRRKVYDKIGGFREGFLKLKNISEDYDWLLRASLFFRFGNINSPEPLYNYRSIPTAMTKDFTELSQFFGQDVAKFLFLQRKEKGIDDLDEGNYSAINAYIEELKEPFNRDPSLFFVKKTELLMYGGMSKAAILNALKAFKTKPNISNLNLLQYCLRRHISSII